MKKIVLLLILISALTCVLTAKKEAKPLAAYLKDNKWYFIDSEGKEMFPPKEILEVMGFTEGYYRIRIKENGKDSWAFMDSLGVIKFKPQSVLVSNLSDGMITSIRQDPYRKELQAYGYYNKDGIEVIPHIFDDGTDFSHGLAFVMNDSISGYVNKTGKLVIPLKDMAGNPFSEGLADVNNRDFKIGFIDTDGIVKINFKFDEVRPFSESKAIIHNFGKFGYIDTSGNYIVKPEFDFANPFKEGRAWVGISNDTNYTAKWGLIDSSGFMVCDYKYDVVGNFSEGLSVVSLDKKFGFVDKFDKVVIPFIYSLADSFVDGLAWAADKTINKYGFINKNNEYVIILDNPVRVFDLRINRRVK